MRVASDKATARRATDAAKATAVEVGLDVTDATLLSDSNRFVVRLTPCDVVARVTPMDHFASAQREVDLVTQLVTQNESDVRTRYKKARGSEN